MFEKDVEIRSVGQAHARALWDLFFAAAARRGAPVAVAALLREGRPVAITDGRRRFAPPADMERVTRENVGRLAARLGARLVAAVEEEELRGAVERIEKGWRRGEDQLFAAELACEALGEAAGRSGLILHPEVLGYLLRLDEEKMRRFFDVVFPPGTSALVYLFEGRSLASGLTFVRGSGGIRLVAGHAALEARLGSWHPWQKGYPAILEAARELHAPPSIGLFAEQGELRRVIASPEPGLFLRGFLAGRIVIDPLPPWAAAALGIDGLSKVATRSVDLIRHLDPLGVTRRFDMGLIGKAIRDKIRKEEIDLESILGFDPFELLKGLISLFAR